MYCCRTGAYAGRVGYEVLGFVDRSCDHCVECAEDASETVGKRNAEVVIFQGHCDEFFLNLNSAPICLL